MTPAYNETKAGLSRPAYGRHSLCRVHGHVCSCNLTFSYRAHCMPTLHQQVRAQDMCTARYVNCCSVGASRPTLVCMPPASMPLSDIYSVQVHNLNRGCSAGLEISSARPELHPNRLSAPPLDLPSPSLSLMPQSVLNCTFALPAHDTACSW